MDHQTGTAAREPLHILVLQKLEARHREALEQAAADGLYDCRFTWLDSAASATQEDVADADVIIGGVDPALISSAPRLKWLQLSWAGADRYTAPGVLPEHVLLTNASGAYGLSVSEHMLTLTLDLQRRMPRYYRQQAAHTWEMFGPLYSVEGSTILVLGMGDIGGDYARKVKALGASTIGVRGPARRSLTGWMSSIRSTNCSLRMRMRSTMGLISCSRVPTSSPRSCRAASRRPTSWTSAGCAA